MSGKDAAGVLAPPPLIYLTFFLLGYLARDLVTFVVFPAPYNWSLGVALALVGAVMIVAPAMRLLRARTALNPYHTTTSIVTSGVFSISRNPIYLGLTAVYLGVAVAMKLTVAILLLPLVIIVMNYGVIRREEAYLERKFGDEYLRYKARVRRWL